MLISKSVTRTAVMLTLLTLLLAGTNAVVAQNTAGRSKDGYLPTTQPAQLDVGSAAPPLHISEWLNGKALQVEKRGRPTVFVLTFWASWSSPSRTALAGLGQLHEKYRKRGVIFIGITEESAEQVKRFLDQAESALPFRVALDQGGTTTQAYCATAGVDFVPYTFVLGPDRTIAWHGHPRQAELVLIIEQLLTGRYNRSQARALVRQARGIDQLESLFREAYAGESWRTALLALNDLLNKDVPKQRLLRYKLAILLGELNDLEQARMLVDQLTKEFARNGRFLNSVAWDVLSEPRLYRHDPEIGLTLARAAFLASGGQDAAIADTYARALHMIGRVDLAIEVQQQAVSRSNSEQRPENERMLSFYRRCQALQATATAQPK